MVTIIFVQSSKLKILGIYPLVPQNWTNDCWEKECMQRNDFDCMFDDDVVDRGLSIPI